MPSHFDISGDTKGEPDLIVRGSRVVTPEGERAASIHIHGGVIEKISSFDDVSAASTVYEAGDSAVMPGLVDTHVHINEPGAPNGKALQQQHARPLPEASPRSSKCPEQHSGHDERAGFKRKLAAAVGKLSVDTGFWGGVVPGNAPELRGLWEAGCFGFKCFLIDSGVQEFASVGEADLQEVLPILAKSGAASCPLRITRAHRKSREAASGHRFANILSNMASLASACRRE